ncbi:MAG: tRNA A-37 threonylcarbamoyl transferase component Bud32 [Halieaceae bacterium]
MALGLSRAQRCFRVSAAMEQVGLPVAKPDRLILVRSDAALPWGCYFVGEQLTGSDLRSLCLEGIAGHEPKLTMAGAELARLHEAGFVHGDCKWSNILFGSEGLFWLDLDNAGSYRKGRAARDIARFVVNAEDFNASPAQLDGFLQAYCTGTKMEVATLLKWIARPLAKLRQRHSKTYGARASGYPRLNS